MARETSYTEYKKIAAAINAGHIAPVYLLHGEESYFIDRLADLLQQTVVDEADRDFNLSLIYGADASVDEMMRAMRQFPVMAGRRLVMLKEAQSMDDFKRKFEKLAPYLEHPARHTVFVITYKGEPLRSTSAAVKAMTKGGGVVFTSSALFDNQVPPVLREYCDSRRMSIDDSAISLLMDFAGVSLSNLTAAVDKIIMSAGGKTSRITTEDVEENIGISKEFDPSELVRAVARRDFPSAMRIADFFIRNPKMSATPVNSRMLFLYFAGLLVCHYSKDKSPRGIAATVGARSEYSNKVRDIEAGLRNYSAARCVRVIRAIREFDAMAKGVGSLRKDTELQFELIYKIFTI